MSKLLVSVRSVAEASVCIHNGADLVDIKEPARGSLGMASPHTIASVLREVPPRFPVSAALGEWMEWRREGTFPSLVEGLSYLKIGLQGAQDVESWREEFSLFCREVSARAGLFGEPSWVAVAYADWERARSPRPEEVLDFAAANGFPVLLLDTWLKDGAGLFEWMAPPSVAVLAELARDRGMEVAIAGSLRESDIDDVLSASPDVVAVRSAACRGRDRNAGIDPAAVRRLAEAIGAARGALEPSA